MSEDEIFVTAASTAVTVAGWLWWYAVLVTVKGPRHAGVERMCLALGPLVASGLLFLILNLWSASDVRDDAAYLWMYEMLGAAWGFLAALSAHLLGLDVRGDVLERGNGAAAAAVFGIVVGSTLAFAGGNIGDGPGWWVVVFSGLLSTGSLFAIWALLDRALALTDVITIDRDKAAGLRAAGFWIAAGLILGRAVAGNWHSAGETLADFCTMAWPVLILAGGFALVERGSHPTPQAPVRATPLFGWCPAMSYIAFGLVSVWMQGPWQ